jgi:hypothetical protein
MRKVAANANEDHRHSLPRTHLDALSTADDGCVNFLKFWSAG